MDLISKYEAIVQLQCKRIEEQKELDGWPLDYQQGVDDGYAYSIKVIKNISPVEFKEGKWITDENGMLKCSNCAKIPVNRIIVKGKVIYDVCDIRKIMKFCPECGIHMKA